MSKTIDIHLVDAFTKTTNSGNRAGVVFGADDLTSEQMQEIAAYANVSETAFIIGSSDPDAYDVQVRYFTPTVEVPICGHATIAAHYLRAAKNNIEDAHIMAKTGAGILPVDIKKEGSDIKVTMTQGTPELEQVLTEEQQAQLKKALKLTSEDLVENLPIQVSSTGHSKVMIPVKKQDILNNIALDLDILEQLSEEVGSDGFYVFTIEDEQSPYRTHGRMFAPAIGIAEDPVTGNANGPAGLYLANHGILEFEKEHTYNAIQGEAIGKAGVVEVSLEKEQGTVSKVMVSGSAIEAETIRYTL